MFILEMENSPVGIEWPTPEGSLPFQSDFWPPDYFGGVILKEEVFPVCLKKSKVSDFWTDKQESRVGCGFSPVLHFVGSPSPATESVSPAVGMLWIFWWPPYKSFLHLTPHIMVSFVSPSAGAWLSDVGIGNAARTHLTMWLNHIAFFLLCFPDLSRR